MPFARVCSRVRPKEFLLASVDFGFPKSKPHRLTPPICRDPTNIDGRQAKLKKGRVKADGKKFKAHLDGYNSGDRGPHGCRASLIKRRSG